MLGSGIKEFPKIGEVGQGEARASMPPQAEPRLVFLTGNALVEASPATQQCVFCAQLGEAPPAPLPRRAPAQVSASPPVPGASPSHGEKAPREVLDEHLVARTFAAEVVLQ